MRNPNAIINLARIKNADDYTYMHSVAVCALMVALAHHLNLDEDQTHEAGMAGLLHDLGKANMPSDILLKPGKLTVEEFDVMKNILKKDIGFCRKAVSLTLCRSTSSCIITSASMAAAIHMV